MPASFRVLLTDRAWPNCDIEREVLAQVGAEIVEAPDGDEATLIALARDVDAIGTCWARVTGRVIRAATRCRGIARFGIGLDNIDLAAANERHIPVSFVPDYCVAEVSDHALALLLACARQVAFLHHRARSGEYARQAASPMHRLSGQTLGLVGFGTIARALAPKARALGLRVVAHNRSGHDYGTGCPIVPFETLLAESDFVSLHLPLCEETRHLLSRRTFERMKPSAYLVNTARGGLIDHDALRDALRENRIAGAALDVFDPEPPDLSAPLFRDERVIVTPHAAFLSVESLRELRTRAATHLAQFLIGERPESLANPQIDENRRNRQPGG